VPQDAADAVRQPGLLDTPQQPAVEGRQVGGILRIPLVLVDPRSPTAPLMMQTGILWFSTRRWARSIAQ